MLWSDHLVCYVWQYLWIFESPVNRLKVTDRKWPQSFFRLIFRLLLMTINEKFHVLVSYPPHPTQNRFICQNVILSVFCEWLVQCWKYSSLMKTCKHPSLFLVHYLHRCKRQHLVKITSSLSLLNSCTSHTHTLLYKGPSLSLIKPVPHQARQTAHSKLLYLPPFKPSMSI